MSKWKDVVKTVAPTLAAVMGGPAAGTAVKFLASKLLGSNAEGKSKSDLEEMLDGLVMGASPEVLAQIKKAEQDFKVKMRELDIQVDHLTVTDRESARSLASNKGIMPHIWLSGLFLMCFFGLLFILFGGQVEIPESARTPANILLGVVGTNVTLIMKFWFGGSPEDRNNWDRLYSSTPRP